MKRIFAALLLSAAAPLAPAAAQVTTELAQPLTGTRLDVNATGEVTRVPDVAIISAGVVTRSTTASAALQENAARMERVVAALKRAGVADRDIQTSSINLNPEYHYQENKAPVLNGYTASNSLSIRFRDIRSSGQILDALVAQGANQINGPTLTIDKPEEAMDEARVRAIANGRQRAELYARTLGLRVVRLLSVSESGDYAVRPPMMAMARAERGSADTSIEAGEQDVRVTIAMAFELR